MADIQLLLEAERRGLLPPDKQALLEEARRRGLLGDQLQQTAVSSVATPAPQAAPPTSQATPPAPVMGDQTAAAMAAYGSRVPDMFKGFGTQLLERVKKDSYGYVLNRASEAAKLYEGAEGDAQKKLTAITDDYVKKIQESDERVRAATPQDLNMLEQSIRSGVESALIAIPGIVASVATKSSFPALAAAGAQTKFDSYASARAEGLGHGEAEIGRAHV